MNEFDEIRLTMALAGLPGVRAVRIDFISCGAGKVCVLCSLWDRIRLRTGRRVIAYLALSGPSGIDWSIRWL